MTISEPNLRLNDYRRSDSYLLINIRGVFLGKIDAAMTHSLAKVLVPISAMNGIILVKINRMGNPKTTPQRTFFFPLPIFYNCSREPQAVPVGELNNFKLAEGVA